MFDTLTTILFILISVLGKIIYSWVLSDYHRKDLPPRLNISMMVMVKMFLNGSFIPLFQTNSKILGSVFYCIFPMMLQPLIVCSDIELAKILLTGDTTTNVSEMEKPRFMCKLYIHLPLLL